MRIEKAETKIAVASELGAKIEDILEAAKKEVSRWEGSVSAFSQASKACEALGEHVDRDVTDGVYDLEVAKVVKRYVDRAAQLTKNLMAQAENNRISTVGKVAALDTTVQVVAKYRDEEVGRVSAFRAALASGQIKVEDGGGMSVADGGVRPARSIKEQRLAEAAAEAKAAEPTVEAAAATEPETPRAKRTRRKRVADS